MGKAAGLSGVAMVCRQAVRTAAEDLVALILALFVMVKAIKRARVLTDCRLAQLRR
jgi:hypothetical protein